MTSFIPSTVSLWNNLDLNIRNSPNISCIKYRIIKENTYYFIANKTAMGLDKKLSEHGK
jgi:predicted secreted Zn-dependent protease